MSKKKDFAEERALFAECGAAEKNLARAEGELIALCPNRISADEIFQIDALDFERIYKCEKKFQKALMVWQASCIPILSSAGDTPRNPLYSRNLSYGVASADAKLCEERYLNTRPKCSKGQILREEECPDLIDMLIDVGHSVFETKVSKALHCELQRAEKLEILALGKMLRDNPKVELTDHIQWLLKNDLGKTWHPVIATGNRSIQDVERAAAVQVHRFAVENYLTATAGEVISIDPEKVKLIDIGPKIDKLLEKNPSTGMVNTIVEAVHCIYACHEERRQIQSGGGKEPEDIRFAKPHCYSPVAARLNSCAVVRA